MYASITLFFLQLDSFPSGHQTLKVCIKMYLFKASKSTRILAQLNQFYIKQFIDSSFLSLQLGQCEKVQIQI